MSDELPDPREDRVTEDRWLTPGVREYAAKALVTAALGGLALFFVFRGLAGFGLHPGEVSMSATGMSVKLVRRVDNGLEYFIAVSPQVGWQDTDIEIKPTDRVEFWASGQVNLSIYRVTESVVHRRRAEALISCVPDATAKRECADARAARYRDSLKVDSLLAPEDLFLPSEIDSMRPRQPWMGPDGDTVMFDRSYPGRSYRKLAPRQPYGRLVGLILPKAEDPHRRNVDSAFSIGRSLESTGSDRKTRTKGDLWLAVNDVWNSKDAMSGPRYPANLFTLDNVGFLWVRIRITE